VLKGTMSRQEIQEDLELKDRRNVRENYLEPAFALGLLAMTHPDNPNHPKQKYILTEKGIRYQKELINS
jgi:hypothetical protein